MTEKQRFVNTMTFAPADRAPFMEIAMWAQTRRRWQAEGMPAGVGTGLMLGCDYFQLEGYETVHLDAIYPRPSVPERTISEDQDHVVFTDAIGRTRKARKSGTVEGMRMSMDTYIDFPVKDRKTFADFRKRYEGDVAERYPADWDELQRRAATTAKPLTLLDPLSGTFGYYSMLRNWMGTEGLSYLLYDDPVLIEECLEFLTDFIVRLMRRALREVEFDFYFIHEDMCFKNGPLVSPALFRKFFLPQYKKFVGFLKSNGVRIVLVDTDGNHELLTPLFLEAGVDGFGPIEVAAGMDAVRIRRQYGRSVCMIGGIDKRQIAKGKRAIENEINRTVVPIVDQGGFIPTIDHSVPPDVCLDDFRYYLELKRKVVFGAG